MSSESIAGKLSFVATHHGTRFVLDSGDRLNHAGEAAPDRQVALFVPARRRELGFLIGAPGARIDIGRRHPPMRFVTLLLTAHTDAGWYNLLEPTSGLYLTSLRSPDEVVASTLTSAQWEAHTLVEMTAQEAEPFETIVEVLSGFIAAGDDARALARFLAGVAYGAADIRAALPALVSAAMTILPRESAAHLCAILLGWETTASINRPWPDHVTVVDDADAAGAESASWLDQIDGEPWFADAVQRLLAWTTERSPARAEKVPTAYDVLGCGDGREMPPFVSPGHKFLAHARRLVAPRHDLAVLATARDEGLYLLEWIAHHRLQGADRIFLYTNDNTDGSDALLAALAESGVITWLDNSGSIVSGINMQHKAYGHALTALPDILDYRWVLTLDLDEFLVLNPIWQNDLPALLRGKEAQGADAVSFQWLVYFTRRDLAWREGTCATRYNYAGWNPLIKTAFRVNQFSFSGAHHPVLRESEAHTFLTADGLVQYGAGATNTSAWINGSSNNGVIAHFAIKSLEEFVWKYARGENDGTGVLLNKHFRYNSSSVVANYINFFNTGVGAPDDRFEALKDALAQEIEHLKTLPGVAEAYSAVVENYRQQIGPLVEGSVDYVRRDPGLSDEQKAAWSTIVDLWAAQANRS